MFLLELIGDYYVYFLTIYCNVYSILNTHLTTMYSMIDVLPCCVYGLLNSKFHHRA